MAFLVLPAPLARADSLGVVEWTLTIGVRDDQGDTEGAFFLDVLNPFSNSHSADLGQNHAETSYDFGWDDAGGTFRLDMTHQAEGTNNSVQRSGSSGGITFTSADTDLLVSVRAEYAYDFPADLMIADLRVGGLLLDPTEVIFAGIDHYSTTFGGPTAGTLSIDDTFLVPAGEPFVISYLTRISASLNSAGSLATGNGFIELDITPTPEPAAVAPLLAALLWLRPRRRR